MSKISDGYFPKDYDFDIFLKNYGKFLLVSTDTKLSSEYIYFFNILDFSVLSNN